MSQQQLKRNDTSIQIMISEEDKLSPLSEPLKVLDRLKESLEHLPQLESFFKKYNEQLSIVTMSLNNVEKITKKSEQLTQDTLIMATKVKSAQKVISEDQLQITQLKREIEKQWSLFDSVKIKDEQSQLKIEKLQNKFDQLQKEIQSGVINEERKRYIEQLEENEQKLRREFEMEQNLKISLINRLTVLQNEYDDLMKEKINILKQIEFMNKEVVELEKTIKEEQVEREKAKIELDEVKSLLKSKIRDIEDTQSKKERNEIELQRYEKKALEQSEKTSKAQRHVEELQFKLEKLQKEFKEQAKQTSKLSAGNENLRLLIKNKEDSIKITKEEQLVHLQKEKLETNLNQYKSKSNLLEKEISEIEQAIKEQTDINKQHHFEIQKLNEIIKQADQERKRQEKEYEAVVNDRDILGAQLIKRNEELANLYERIKSQQALLYKGSIQYQQRLNEIEILNEKINQLQIQVKELENILIPNFKIKKNHINTLQKNLLQEQQRIKVLEDELNTPMNVHGWRKLQGSDPQNYENVKKIQKLQKQLPCKN
ncbi:hypothetical protein ABK040_010249 [Willaertia magna]